MVNDVKRRLFEENCTQIKFPGKKGYNARIIQSIDDHEMELLRLVLLFLFNNIVDYASAVKDG